MSRKRHRQHGNPFNVRGPLEVPDWDSVFGRVAPFALDIGCGAGAYALELGRRNPQWNVVGLEIREHFVDGLNHAAQEAGLRNVHALLANANIHLRELVPDESVAFVSVNFPDPWYKKRHHKRRVVREEWLEILSRKLSHGAEVHAVSDYEPIALEMRQLFEEAAGFVNSHGRGCFAAENTTGIASEREQTHLSRREPVYRMQFVWLPESDATQAMNRAG